MTRFFADTKPHLEALPGLVRLELSSPFESLALGERAGDRRGPPFLMVETYFASRGDFDLAMVSDVGRLVLRDMERQEDAAVTVFLAEVTF